MASEGARVVYVVTGESGMYSDHSMWVVKVWTDADAAEAHRAACEAEAKIRVACRADDWDYEPGPCTLDPHLSDDLYDEHTYHVTALPLDDFAALGLAPSDDAAK